MKLSQLEEELAKANDEIKRLKEILLKDSSNSSKPPSTDNIFTQKSSNKKDKSKKEQRCTEGT